MNIQTLRILRLQTGWRFYPGAEFRHQWLCALEGASFLLAGLLAFFLSNHQSMEMGQALAIALLLGGIAKWFGSLRYSGNWLLISALLTLAVGGWLFAASLAGPYILSGVIAFYLIFEGTGQVVFGLGRNVPANGKHIAGCGVLAIALAGFAFSPWPLIIPRVLDGLVGIYLLSCGAVALLQGFSGFQPVMPQCPTILKGSKTPCFPS